MTETLDNASPQEEAKKEKKSKKIWTLEKCLKAARRFSSQSEWALNAPSSFKSAKSHGWIDQCIRHMTPNTSQKKKAPAKKAATPRPGKLSA